MSGGSLLCVYVWFNEIFGMVKTWDVGGDDEYVSTLGLVYISVTFVECTDRTLTQYVSVSILVYITSKWWLFETDIIISNMII